MKTKRSHYYIASVSNPSIGVGSTQSPSDEAYMGGFTMRKPYGRLIEGLVYLKSPHMPVPMRTRHDQGIGDELTAVHLSTILVHDICAMPQRSLVPKVHLQK